MNATFWAYIHDAEGELTEDLGDYSTLEDAADELISNMRYNHADWYLTHTARVVETSTQATVWRAGPTRIVSDAEETMRDGIEQALDPMITVSSLDID